MRALSIRQPYSELILRGLKRIEYRSFATKIIGERFWIYAAGKKWSAWPVTRADNIVVPTEKPPEWMMELANLLNLGELPTGVIVGSAVIERCERVEGRGLRVGSEDLTSNLQPQTSFYEWHLTGVERAARLRKPSGHPQPAWFKPF